MNPLPVILLQRHKCSGTLWLICLNKYDTGNILLCIYYLIQIHALSLLPCILYYYTKTWMCSAVIFFCTSLKRFNPTNTMLSIMNSNIFSIYLLHIWYSTISKIFFSICLCNKTLLGFWFVLGIYSYYVWYVFTLLGIYHL